MNASTILPALLHPHQACDNGSYPSANYYAAAQATINHIVAYRRKPCWRYSVPLGTAGGTSGVAWRGYFKTGHGCKNLVLAAVMGLDDRVLAVDPYIEVTVTEVGGAALPAVQIHYGVSSVASVDDPDSLSRFVRYIPVSDATEYTVAVEFFDNVRPLSLELHEEEIRTVDDGTDYFSTFAPAAGSPVEDNWVGRQLEGIGAMLRNNRGLRYDWMRPDGVARTRSSATPINLLDNSTTGTPTGATPGVTFATTARRTHGKNEDRVKIAVYGSNGGAGSGTVRFRDTSGSDAAVVTINGAAGWYTATGTLTVGSAQKYDLMFAGDGVNTVSVYAVSIFEADS